MGGMFDDFWRHASSVCEKILQGFLLLTQIVVEVSSMLPGALAEGDLINHLLYVQSSFF